MSYTPPVIGSSDWGTPLNQALADIDDTAEAALLIGTDLLAGTASGTAAGAGTTASLTYTDLTGSTVGPSVSVTLAASRMVVVLFRSSLLQVSTTDDVYVSAEASGATTQAASDNWAIRHNGSGTAEGYASFFALNCNAGTTTFTMKYRVDGGSGSFAVRNIAALVT